RYLSPVWAEGRVVDIAGVPFESGNELTGADVPDFDGLIPARGNQAAAVPAEFKRKGDVVMALNGADRLTARRVPDPQGAVLVGRRDPFPVGAKRDVEDGSFLADRPECPSRRRIPDFQHPTLAGQDQSCSVRAEFQASYRRHRLCSKRAE